MTTSDSAVRCVSERDKRRSNQREDQVRRLMATALLAILIATTPTSIALAHKIDRVTIKSICHYEELYYVWTPDEPWKVWGRVKPAHGHKKVVLQKSKRGNKWRKWKVAKTTSDGRYKFKGIAPDKGPSWHVLLRVKFPTQGKHEGKASLRIYVDENPNTQC